MKNAKRNYDVKCDGQIFHNAFIVEAPANSDFYNIIREEIYEKYSGTDQVERIDHVSRIIHLNY